MQPRLFNLRLAAQYLSMSTRMLEELIRLGEIPVKQVLGFRRNFFDIHDLDRFVEQNMSTVEQRSVLEQIERRRKA